MVETIVATVTPPGRGGVAIVRLSGPLSYRIALQIVKKTELTPRTVHYCSFYAAHETTIPVSISPFPDSTSRALSAGSSNVGKSLDPADKARDVGDVVLAETMNEAEFSKYFWAIFIKNKPLLCQADAQEESRAIACR